MISHPVNFRTPVIDLSEILNDTIEKGKNDW